jgi:hypothetical protein
MGIITRKDGIIWTALACGGVLLILVLALSTPPAYAQAPLPTPTAYPAIEATKQAAQAQLDAARQQQAQADADITRAEERRRNAEAQAASAERNLSDARAAAVAQNGVAAGEAIGRAVSDLQQMRASLDSIMQINAGNVATVKAQAGQIISLTIENQQQRVTIANYQRVAEAQTQALAEAQAAPDSSVVPMAIIALVFLALLVVVSVVVNRRRVVEREPVQVYGGDDVIDGASAGKEDQWTG